MKKEIICSILIVAVLFTSCINLGERVNGSGNIKTESREVNKAVKIKVMGDIDVFVDQGPTSVKVEGDDNVLRYIETVSNNGWLEVKTRDHINIKTERPIKVYIATPEITDLNVSGSGNIKCNQKFSTNDYTSFNISGSGDILAAINAPTVNAHISGSGNLHISGETKDVEIHISGSGNYDGTELKAENAKVSIAGSGDASLFADNKLKATIAGSGNIKYRGSATVDSHIAGSGSVSKMQ